MSGGWFQQVRRWFVPETNWGAVYTDATNTAHGLEDGSQAPTAPGVWPDMSPTQVDSWYGYVRSGGATGTYYPIGRAYVTISDYDPLASTAAVQITVDNALRDECWQRNINPDGVVIVALPHLAHSEERSNTDLGENFPAALGGTLGAPFWAIPSGGGADLETVYVDPATGDDTDDGHTPTTPWETMGRVQEYMEDVGTFYHSFMVIMQPGPVGTWDAASSDFGPSGVRFIGNSRLYLMGSVDFVTNPVAIRYGPRSGVSGVTANVDKQLTVDTGVAAAAAINDHNHIRFSPQNGEIWQDLTGPGNVALAAADIGKTIIFEGTNGQIAYATVSAVDGELLGVTNRWVEVNVNHPLLTGGVPAWMLAVGATWTILDPDDGDGTQYTRVAGRWHLQGIKAQAGTLLGGHDPAAGGYAGDDWDGQSCISHVVFTAEQVTLEDCTRMALPGCRFEEGLHIGLTQDCTCISNAISDNLDDRYFTDAAWDAQGFNPVGDANSWGGMGFHVVATATGGWHPGAGAAADTNLRFTGAQGIVAGMTVTSTAGDAGDVYAAQICDLAFTWGSFGPDATGNLNNLCGVRAGVNSRVSVTNCNLCCMLYADTYGLVILGSPNSWIQRAVNVVPPTDTPVMGTAATHVTMLGDALIRNASHGNVVVNNTQGTSIEGINADAGGNVVVRMGEGGVLVMTGGHDANWAGCAGFFRLLGGCRAYITGDRTFPQKPNAAGAGSDVYLSNSLLQSGPEDIWEKTGDTTGDTTPSPVLEIHHHSDFKLGTPVQGAPAGRLVVGATGAGNGVNCGAAGVVNIDDASRVTISDFRINNDDGVAGNPAIIVQNAAFLHFTGENVNSFIEQVGVAGGTEITQGSIATVGYVPTGEAAHRALYSDYLAVIGTAQGTYINHE
jgi:hypothetical protein